ncbi:unnamed protein product [Natator depressus]
MAGATPTTVASSSTMASLPAVASTSSASVPPPAPRAYARVVAAPPPPAASSSRPPTASATINSSRGPFPTMTRKHGVHCLLVPTSPHVETYVQALARVVGPTAIVAASKMYGKVVFFLASEAAAQEAVEKGLAVGGGGVRSPGTARGPRCPPSPDLRPSFSTLLPALSTLGKSISVISPLALGCKDPTLRHVLSFRRQVQLLPPPAARDGEALEGSFLVPYQEPAIGSFTPRERPGATSADQQGMSEETAPWPSGEGHPRPPRPGRTSAPSLPTPLAARYLKPPLLLLGPKRHLPYNAQMSKGAPPLLLTIQQSWMQQRYYWA